MQHIVFQWQEVSCAANLNLTNSCVGEQCPEYDAYQCKSSSNLTTREPFSGSTRNSAATTWDGHQRGPSPQEGVHTTAARADRITTTSVESLAAPLVTTSENWNDHAWYYTDTRVPQMQTNRMLMWGWYGGESFIVKKNGGCSEDIWVQTWKHRLAKIHYFQRRSSKMCCWIPPQGLVLRTVLFQAQFFHIRCSEPVFKNTLCTQGYAAHNMTVSSSHQPWVFELCYGDRSMSCCEAEVFSGYCAILSLLHTRYILIFSLLIAEWHIFCMVSVTVTDRPSKLTLNRLGPRILPPHETGTSYILPTPTKRLSRFGSIHLDVTNLSSYVLPTHPHWEWVWQKWLFPR